MIKVVHNSAGSGDWVEVWNGDEIIHQSHTITPNDLVDILNTLTANMAIKINITDDQFEDMSWKELV
jgi:hypothetical protein